MRMEEERGQETGIVSEVFQDKQYPVTVYIVHCHCAWQFDASLCWTKDNCGSAGRLAYLHIDYLWRP